MITHWTDNEQSNTKGLTRVRHGIPRRVIRTRNKNSASYADYPGTTVGIDNAGGSRSVTEHLIAQGARRLLFVLDEREHLGQQQRWAGAREAWLKQNSLDTLLFSHKEARCRIATHVNGYAVGRYDLFMEVPLPMGNMPSQVIA